ncbi:putative pre-mRNA-splicing factor ATP-dependent RNA helicase C20H4.09 [Cucumis melo var. makuwa]|uniref:RNA helicase n=1 Tax=Cucumis melo var. makuwa TaxID=1194695 RepID=A0A5A7TE68_CUCMM|nr:putative pre-mRNA-splicing factor ATP-dependent RNA helicase C20H4.09 [Cucumis melo var. makuwa]TYK23035.1 putative pre-mRNA-splicing factor ATP-dependent RNA helicase C20H4.09 [Cucumis melo var. makuwa]
MQLTLEGLKGFGEGVGNAMARQLLLEWLKRWVLSLEKKLVIPSDLKILQIQFSICGSTGCDEELKDIMVDEAHERSISTDMLLGLLKKIQRRRPDLRLIISSATIEAKSMSTFFQMSCYHCCKGIWILLGLLRTSWKKQ